MLCAMIWCPILLIWQNYSGPLGGGWGAGQGGVRGGTDDDADAHWKVRINLLKESRGFKKIEVASRFEKSNQLYQPFAFSHLLLDGSGGVQP